MRHHRQWRDHRFTMSWEIYCAERTAGMIAGSSLLHAHDDTPIDSALATVLMLNFLPMMSDSLEDLWWELEIEASSTGYYEPQTARDPAERGDERTVVSVRIRPAFPDSRGYDDSKGVTLNASFASVVFEIYRKQIESHELGSLNDDPPED